jgi:nicotinate (nicotinamide) nucleotide adenylyltransferase
MLRLALFGTSADPPTFAHQAILEWLAQQFDQVAVWAADNPFKQGQTPLLHRQAMLGLLIEHLQNQSSNLTLEPELSDWRTLRTVETARQRWPKADLTLVVGTDVIATMLHWYQIQKLLPQVKLLIVARPGVQLVESDLTWLKSQGARLTIADFTGPEISSTAYRQQGSTQGLISAIANYIQQENLYAANPSAPALPSFRVGVDNVIFSVDTQRDRLLVLLVKRDQAPFLGEWCLPGTLVRQGESLEAAADRILSEKIRVQNLYLEQLYTFSNPQIQPGKTPITEERYLSISYFALVRYEAVELIRDRGSIWYPLEQVPTLAFNHQQILAYGHQRLCSKLEYSPIAFEVLPETFTLNDLYQLYSTVLGEDFADYSNFRTRLLKLGFLQDTGQKVTRGAGRPASLYRFDSEAFAPLKNKPLVFV